MGGKGADALGVKQAAFLDKFTCLADECEDTCCQGWGMQVDNQHKNLYEKEAPELLDALTSGEAEIIMKRDPVTGFCVKLQDGLCGIHKKYGEKFLGDACYFFPRITRRLGDVTYMSAAMSCPEVTRLVLFSDAPFESLDKRPDRLPLSLRNYADGQDGKKTLGLVHDFIDIAGDENNSPERALALILNISKSLESQSEEKWPEAFAVYKKIGAKLLHAAKPQLSDSYKLLNILVALIKAAGKGNRLRLDETVATMEQALGVRIDRESLQIINASGDKILINELEQKWQENASKEMAPVLRRWLQAEISANSFPYAGFGNDLAQRRIILAARFATVRLALMSHMDESGNPPDDETTVRVIQSLARFLGHLTDPTFSIMLYSESGWTQEARLRALIGDK